MPAAARAGLCSLLRNVDPQIYLKPCIRHRLARGPRSRRVEAAFRPLPPTRLPVWPEDRRGRNETAGCARHCRRLVPAARQIASACARISRSSFLTGCAKNGWPGSLRADGTSDPSRTAISPEMNNRSPARIAGVPPLNSGATGATTSFCRHAVLCESNCINFDPELRHDEAGRLGRDDRCRGLNRKMLRPDLAKAGDVGLIAQDRPAP